MHGPNSHTPFLNMYKSVRVKTHTLLYIHTHTQHTHLNTHAYTHVCMAQEILI